MQSSKTLPSRPETSKEPRIERHVGHDFEIGWKGIETWALQRVEVDDYRKGGTISYSGFIKIALAGVLLVVAGCSLPRGAPQKSEVVRTQGDEDADFVVEEVDRSSVNRLNSWPATGWHGHFHWFSSGHGPETNVIRTGDFITLKIWDSQPNSLLANNGERSATMENLVVSPAGEIYVPYAENIVVGGLTPVQARLRVQEKLQPIAASAQVQLELNPGQGNAVDLVGGVLTPGTYPLANRNTTILSVIARGGGVSSSIGNPLVRLIRGSHEYEIRAEELMSNSRHNVTVQGGDKIVIGEDERFFIAYGATREERLVPFHKEKITALEAVSILGGMQDNRANPTGLLVLREYPASRLGNGETGPVKQKVVFSLDVASADGLFSARKFQINPGDVIIATESALRPAEALVGLIGSAFAIIAVVK